MPQIWRPDTCGCVLEVKDAQVEVVKVAKWCDLHFSSAGTDKERFENVKKTNRLKNKVDAIVRDEMKIKRGVRIPFLVDSGGVVHISAKGASDKIRKLKARLASELHPHRIVVE